MTLKSQKIGVASLPDDGDGRGKGGKEQGEGFEITNDQDHLTPMQPPKICLTTLAMGFNYRQHALKLAQDVQLITHNMPLVILTDYPTDFVGCYSVIPIKHQIQSVGVYHDKLNCVEESFRQGFDICIFLDADCRLLENLPMSRSWKQGITAHSCYDLTKGIGKVNRETQGFSEWIDEIAKHHHLDLQSCKFINEWLFIVYRDGNEDRFLEAWRDIRDSLESKRVFHAEGAVIGMAAQLAGWPVYHYNTGYPESQDRHNIINIYKDRIFATPESIPDNYKEKITALNQERISIEQQKNPLLRRTEKLMNLLAREKRYLELRRKFESSQTLEIN